MLRAIHCVVAPVLHKYDDKPEGAHHCAELPEQIDPKPDIKQLGGVPEVSVSVQLLVQPFASVTVTV